MRSRATSNPAVETPAPATPPVRIRHLLLVALLVGLAYGAYPRAQAAWQLHTLATSLADYGLCMAGPTGAAALRDDIATFRSLLRRRVVASAADERPFERCAAAARTLGARDAVVRAHHADAWQFTEFGSPQRHYRVSDLAVTTRRLAELHEAAWPFVREGYTRLVRPSLHAHEAAHPVALVQPALGQGLPAWTSPYRVALRKAEGQWLLSIGQAANLSAYQSRDDGVTWRAVAVPDELPQAGRCVGPEARHGFSFGIDDSGREWRVYSSLAGNESSSAKLASADAEIVAASCDERALVAIIESERQPGRRLAMQCQHAGRCAPLKLPGLGEGKPVEQFPIDVARVAGATVVSVRMGQLVRVASSRDGETWAPYTLAYDAAENSLGGRGVPWRLLVLEGRLLLYAGSKDRRGSYPVLISDDAGASWRAPRATR